MPITLPVPPTAPSLSDPATFGARADARMLWENTLVTTWNANPPLIATDFALGVVNSFAFCQQQSVGTFAPGSTTPGGNLRYAGLNPGTSGNVATTLAGTWRCLGYSEQAYHTLWHRIA